MRRIATLAIFLGFLTPVLTLSPAHAQATRSWVSGVGDDANPCSRTAPCKTFAGAISKTVAEGEIDCLDPGGFGAITITKSITLDCSETVGSILVAGTNGVVISAGPADKVVLRNIRLQGLGPTGTPGLAGIKILSAGVVAIENCVVTQFSQQGILDVRTAGGKLLIKNTVASLNAGAGVAVAGTSPNFATIDALYSFNNLFGIATGSGNNVTVKRSAFGGNTTGVEADGGGNLSVDDSSISGNGTGANASGAIRLSNSDITFNTTAFAGTVNTYGNNRVSGNTNPGTALVAASPAQQ